jgi:hypothetical protein
MPIKTFRGRLADGSPENIERIRLSTNDGMRGYRIVKFQLMSQNPITTSAEHIVKVYKIKQDTATNDVDFSDSTLLAAGLYIHNDNYSNTQTQIIFDQEVFNQDIFVTHDTDAGSDACNYYLELEAVALNKNSQSVVTLKDIRANTTQT